MRGKRRGEERGERETLVRRLSIHFPRIAAPDSPTCPETRGGQGGRSHAPGTEPLTYHPRGTTRYKLLRAHDRQEHPQDNVKHPHACQEPVTPKLTAVEDAAESPGGVCAAVSKLADPPSRGDDLVTQHVDVCAIAADDSDSSTASCARVVAGVMRVLRGEPACRNVVNVMEQQLWKEEEVRCMQDLEAKWAEGSADLGSRSSRPRTVVLPLALFASCAWCVALVLRTCGGVSSPSSSSFRQTHRSFALRVHLTHLVVLLGCGLFFFALVVVAEEKKADARLRLPTRFTERERWSLRVGKNSSCFWDARCPPRMPSWRTIAGGLC